MVARHESRVREYARDARIALRRRNQAIKRESARGRSLRDIGAEAQLSHTAIKKILAR